MNRTLVRAALAALVMAAGCAHALARPDPMAPPQAGNGNAPPPVNPEAPRPRLGAGVPAPGVLLGLSPEEIARVKAAPADSELGRLRALVQHAARLADPVLTIEPGKHLIDTKMNKDVPANLAMDLGFLIDWNELMDALGLAYAITGDPKYAARVDDHLRPWIDYSPPMGVGLTKGGEPGIYHRNFYGCLRAADHCLEKLTPEGRSAAVHLAVTIQDRLEDWWSKTAWERGNHAAATAQTGICAGILLMRAAALDPTLISPAEAKARLDKFLDAGGTIAPAALVGGQNRQPGLVGFGPQACVGVLTPESLPLYEERWNAGVAMLGATMDFLYKPPNSRFGYHALVAHHMLTGYWSLVRSGLDRSDLAKASEARAAIGLLLEFSRPYLQDGQMLAGAKGQPPVPVTDRMTRQVIAMAARLFPEKTWLENCRRRGQPVGFAEIYTEVALFQ
jgi:hypothetical protein